MADPEPISLRPQQPVPPRPLPPGWKMSQSEKGVYYWHKDTKRTQWHFPDEEGNNAGVVGTKMGVGGCGPRWRWVGVDQDGGGWVWTKMEVGA